MAFEKGNLIVVLFATLSVAISQAAPTELTPRQVVVTPGDSKPIDGGESAGGVPVVIPGDGSAGGVPGGPPTGIPNPTDVIPNVQPDNSTDLSQTAIVKPTIVKPVVVKPAHKPNPGKDVEEVVADEAFQHCWSCLLEAAEDLCSYLMDWTNPSKLSAVNLLSFFQDKSSDESSESSDSESSGSTGNSAISAISNIFRFRRSARFEPSVEGAPIANGALVEGIPIGEMAFLDLLHGFYLTMRERFSRQNPGLISPNIVNLYKRPDELVEVAAYVLGVPKNSLLEVYGKIKSKETGSRLLRALDDRMAMLEGEQRNNLKTLSLSPTSISHFFNEFLSSVSGIATRFTEFFNIALPNQGPQPLRTLELSIRPQIY